MSGVKPDPRQQSNCVPPGGALGGGGGQLSAIRKIESEHNRPLFDRTGGSVPESCANDLFRCDRSPDLLLRSIDEMEPVSMNLECRA